MVARWSPTRQRRANPMETGSSLKLQAHSVNGSTLVSKTKSRGSNPLGPARANSFYLLGFFSMLLAMAMYASISVPSSRLEVEDGIIKGSPL